MMRKTFYIGLLLVFIAGIIIGTGTGRGTATAKTGQERNKQSPSDWVKADQIKVYKDRVVIDEQNVIWAEFTDTKSMDPTFDSTAHALEIVPKSSDQLNIGDIISYNSPYANIPLIHRITEIGNDGEWYAVVKGDNNDVSDPGKVRFENVNRVVIALIY